MDPRIARTRRSLQRAMLALASERDLEDFTVADIVERAEVNRSSFYQHYSDKDTLLADAIDHAMQEDGADLPPLLDLVDDSPPSALVVYLQHFEAYAAVYARVFGERGSPVAVARLQGRVREIARDAIEHSGTTAFGGMPVDVAAAGVAGSVTGVLGAWIALEPRPTVGTAAAWIWQVLVGPGELGLGGAESEGTCGEKERKSASGSP
ncbi:TetR/AcrR family transcriptional regulator [Serinibacter arcticus]|uniref:TetR/AcrR family transcriptional regulator n=1 Tax=Serinibacter arcticus TaxID=1655435 RepID=A0A2U1ZVY2_9MICO|nr:TetR/AcrR family transcriptional regulator [Serinibacter arcticus]PWD51082.1 TetR/AcrR family transcriptional regulator [Serinibacter arcticus]